MEESGNPPILYLVPTNTAAQQAAADPLNEAYRWPMENGTFSLGIGFADPAKQVFTLGRADCDIFLPDSRGADISKHHCSFTNTERGAVLLQDLSSKKNTEPYSLKTGGQTIDFDERRCVLVARGINNTIGIGRNRFYQFELNWQSDGLYPFPDKEENYRIGPRKSKQKKYIEGDEVGGGSYGTVFWAMDVYTGELMAVKRFRNLEGKHLDFATREVANLFRINRHAKIHHEHILGILDYAMGTKGDWGEIFMPLKTGNLKTLVRDRPKTMDVDNLAYMVLCQMLRALTCISRHGIVHRDIKPENILWEEDDDGDYHFCLGDFGLSNSPELAVTVAGTEPFMAPEVFNRGKQTDKIDIWSLFATIVWVRNVDHFRTKCAKTDPRVIHQWLNQIATQDEWFILIQSMASISAKKRPSAKQLLGILNLAGDEEEGDLADSLDNVLTLDPTGEDEEDPGVGPSGRRRRHGKQVAQVAKDDADNGDEVLPVAYYEPYLPDPGNLGHYAWEPRDEGDESEGSKTYAPPRMGESPRAGGEAFVKPYDQIYAQRDEGDPDSGTAVPELWTARQLPTQEMHEPAAAAQVSSQSRDHRTGKGKKKRG